LGVRGDAKGRHGAGRATSGRARVCSLRPSPRGNSRADLAPPVRARADAFAPAYDDVYELAIKAARDEAGAYAERVDKQIFSGSILDRLFNQISKADLVVADMSERNPNVFYEVGYAHALGKTTILLTRDEADIPFDLKHRPHIVYGDSLSRLKAELARRVRWHLENPDRPAAAAPDLVVRANRVELTGHPTVGAKMRGAENSIRLQVTCKNRSARAIRTLSFRIGLLVPTSIVAATTEQQRPQVAIVDEGRRVFASPVVSTLLPEELEVVDYRLTPHNPGAAAAGERYECCVRLHLESGVLDFPFTLAVGEAAAEG
jgi:hypothetical protein